MNPQQFRPLLPRGGYGFPQRAPETQSLYKRTAIAAACESCRRRKSKCDGARPRCNACAAHDRECIYTTDPSESRQNARKRRQEQLEQSVRDLQQSHDALRMLVGALQVKDESEALSVFRSLREGINVEAVVGHLRDGELLMHAHGISGARLRYEFPYRKQMPEALLKANNPYVKSLLYDSALTNPRRVSIPQSDPRATDEDITRKSPYIQPYRLASIVDSRLDHVMPSRWTTVLEDDGYLRMLLKIYFQYEHQFFSFFHKDLFLDDMLSGSTMFCSELLINAVLALACSCCRTIENRYEFWSPHTLGYKFFAEARRMWEIEVYNGSSITTVQASLIINVVCNLYAMDRVGISFGNAAIQMAHDLNLFAPNAYMADISKQEQKAYTYTAWSLYFWVSIMCHQLCIPPLMQAPPENPLPDPSEEWYSESWVQYPLDDVLYPLNHPTFFKSKCEFAVILNQLCVAIYDEDGKKIEPAQEEIRDFLKRLGTWHFFLPRPLCPANIIFPFELNLHLAYYAAMLSTGELASPHTSPSPADDIVEDVEQSQAHSSICFETIMRLYYLHHGYEIPDGHMAHNLMMLAYKALTQVNTPTSAVTAAHADAVTLEEARSTLILAATGLYDQGKNYFLPWALFQIVENEMSEEDRELLHNNVTVTKDDSETIQAREKYISSQYPVTFIGQRAGLEERQLGKIIKGFPYFAGKKASYDSSSGT